MWRVEFSARTAFVTGPKVESRRRLAACGDDSPIWVNRREAWATSTEAANRLLDQLDARNIPAIVEDREQARMALDALEAEPSRLPAPAAPQTAQGGLW